MPLDNRLTRPLRAKRARVRDLPLELVKVSEIRQCELGDYVPGIYFLVHHQDVVYVGQSTTPRARIMAHMAEGVKEFDNAFIRHCAPKELDVLEKFFIDVIQPIYNTIGGASVPHRSKVEIARIIEAFENRQAVPTMEASIEENSRDRETLADTVGQSETSTQSALNPTGFVRLTGLGRLGVPYGKASIWRMVKTGEFPQPIKLGPNVTVWRIGDVLNWLQQRASQPYVAKKTRTGLK